MRRVAPRECRPRLVKRSLEFSNSSGELGADRPVPGRHLFEQTRIWLAACLNLASDSIVGGSELKDLVLVYP